MAKPIVQLIDKGGDIVSFEQDAADRLISTGNYVRADDQKLAGEWKANARKQSINAAVQGAAEGLTASLNLTTLDEKQLAERQANALEHPQAYGLGQLAGTVATGWGASAAMATVGAAKGLFARVLTQAGVQGAIGATQTAVSDIAKGVAENRDVISGQFAANTLKDAMFSGAIGAVLGGAGTAVGAGTGALARGAKNVEGATERANNLALKLGGVAPGEAGRLAAAGEEQAYGQYLRGNNLIRGDSKEILKKAQNLAGEAGAKIESAVNQADKLGAQKVSTDVLYREMRDALVPAKDTMQVVQADGVSVVDRYFKKLGRRNTTEMSLGQLQGLKNDMLADAVKLGRGDWSAAPQGLKDAIGVVSRNIDDGVRAIEVQAGKGVGPKGEAFSQLRTEYKAAKDTASTFAPRRAGKDIIGSTDAVDDAMKSGASTLSRLTSSALRTVGREIDTGRLIYNEWRAGNSTSMKLFRGFLDLTDNVGKAADRIGVSTAASRVATNYNIKDYDLYSQNIQELAANPQQLADRTSRHFSELSADDADQQEIGSQAQMKMLAKVQYLEQYRPKPPGDMIPSALESRWQASSSAKSEFMDRVRGVLDPVSVAERPTRASMDALRATNPAVADLVSNVVMNRVLNNPKVSYSTKLSISKIMGAPVSSMASPDFAGKLTAIYQQVQDEAQQGQTGSARTAGAKQMKLKSAQDEMTQFNNLQNRGN